MSSREPTRMPGSPRRGTSSSCVQDSSSPRRSIGRVGKSLAPRRRSSPDCGPNRGGADIFHSHRRALSRTCRAHPRRPDRWCRSIALATRPRCPDSELAYFGAFKLSPSGEKLAIIVTEATSELWVYDLARGTRTRLNTNANSGHPLWTPDGKWVLFSSSEGGAWNIFRQPADGSAQPSRLVSSANNQIPYAWSPDGRVLAYSEVDPTTRGDIWLFSESDRQPRPLLKSGSSETQPAISPDGAWLAYVSDESGKSEVYVTSHPEVRGRTLISFDGGEEPIWSRDGKELFYRNGQRWMSVTVSTRPTFDAGRPRMVFEGNYLNVSGLSYDITADGRRFVLIRGLDAPPAREIHVVLNWFEELKRLTDRRLRSRSERSTQRRPGTKRHRDAESQRLFFLITSVSLCLCASLSPPCSVTSFSRQARFVSPDTGSRSHNHPDR